MNFIYITNDPFYSSLAQSIGVNTIMIDLERLGKIERQGHLDTVISNHQLSDISIIRDVLSSSQLMVRVNPLNSHSADEVNEVISRGADRIMLPMFRYPSEVSTFASLVNNRVPITLLLETASAFIRLSKILDLHCFDHIHIGLNDLHLELKLDFMFELFSSDLFHYSLSQIKSSGYTFGIGGVAKLDSGAIPGSLVLPLHKCLGSSSVILSRSFFRQGIDPRELFKLEFDKLTSFFNSYHPDLKKDNLLFDNALVDYLGY